MVSISTCCVIVRTAIVLVALGVATIKGFAAQSFWKQVNGKQTRALPNNPIWSLAFSSQGYLFAGTNGAGIFRSSDYGETWQSANPDLKSTIILSLVVDAHGRIWAGTHGRGLFFSNDNGVSWLPGDTSLKNSRVFSLVTSARGDIFIGTGSGGIFRLHEESQSLINVSSNSIRTPVLSFAMNSQGDIFAGTKGEGVLRSKDCGATWTLVNQGLLDKEVFALAANKRNEIFAGTSGEGVFRLLHNEDNWAAFNEGLTNPVILTLALDHRGELFAGSNGSGVFRLRSGDENWSALSDGGLSNAQVFSHALDPYGVIFLGTYRDGVFRSIHPAITHTAITKRVDTEPIPIRADISEDISLDRVSLNFRKSGDRDFISLPMFRGGQEYEQSIPRESVTSRGVEYFITANAINGLSNREPASGFHSISIDVENEFKPTRQFFGEHETSYRLFSVPLDLENKDARAVLEDDLGQYKNSEWRFYELREDSNYYELPDVSLLLPGKAFWLIVKRTGQVIDTGPGRSNFTDSKYAISLDPAWNFVANPFNFTIPVQNLSLKRNKEMPELRSYQGQWNDATIESLKVKEIQPFEGYAIFVESRDTLLVNPDLTDSTGLLFSRVHAITTDERRPWLIRIHARCRGVRDGDNVAIISANAYAQHDDLDHPEPPVIGEYVSVYFPHREWDTLAKTYCIDARPEPTEGEVWGFEVKTNIRDKVNLTFEGIASVPSEFEVWLVDEALQITQNLRESATYSVAGSEHPKALRLVVGKREFIAEQLAEIALVPATYELSQNFPNPFNPVTTIRYGLPQAERVSLKIYNLLGEEVATLVHDEQKAAGYHVAIWDGRGKNGNGVASGVYAYRMTAGSFTSTKKLALIK